MYGASEIHGRGPFRPIVRSMTARFDETRPVRLESVQ